MTNPLDFGDFDSEAFAKLAGDILNGVIAGENENIKEIALSLRSSLTQLTATQAALAPTHTKEIEVLATHLEQRMKEFGESLRWKRLFSFGISEQDIEELKFEMGLEEARRLREVVSFVSHSSLKELYQTQVQTTLVLTPELVKLVESEKVRSGSLDAVKLILNKLVTNGES